MVCEYLLGLLRRTLGLVPVNLPKEKLLLFDPWKDQKLRSSWSWTQCLGLLSLTGAQRLVRVGKDHAQHMQQTGRLGALQLLQNGAIATSTVDAHVLVKDGSVRATAKAYVELLRKNDLLLSKTGKASEAGCGTPTIPAMVTSEYFRSMGSLRLTSVKNDGKASSVTSSNGGSSPRSTGMIPDFWAMPVSPRCANGVIGVTGVTGVSTPTGTWRLTAAGSFSNRCLGALNTVGPGSPQGFISSPGFSPTGTSSSRGSLSSCPSSPLHVSGSSSSSSTESATALAPRGAGGVSVQEKGSPKNESSFLGRWGSWAADTVNQSLM
jgi:hypothetical protein